jgi:subtilisin family serine protease
LSGTPGLIPDAQFEIADIFHADADGEPASDTLSMLRAFDWLEVKNVNIINMSLSGPQDDLVRKAIEKLSAKGILFVAAAGNDGPAAGPSYPAAYGSVIAVTAVGKDMQSYRYANRGTYIDIAAPGVAIWTALPGSKEGYHSGTSFATPYVTATLATIYSRHAIKSKPEALNQMSFRDLGAPGRDPIYGEGLLVAPATCGGNQIAGSSHTPPQSDGNANLAGSPEAERLPWTKAAEQ